MIVSLAQQQSLERPVHPPGPGLSLPGTQRLRLAVLISHPVHYFAPLFRELAGRPEIDLTVIYCSLKGASAYFDPEFGRRVQWDAPLLEGYRYKALWSVWPERTRGLLAYCAPRVVREIHGRNCDALIVFGWGNLTCWLAFAKARLQTLPWMLYGDTNATYEGDKRGAKRWLRTRLLRWLFRRTSAFLISGGPNRRFYQRCGVPAERCFDAPFAVDNSFFEAAAGHWAGRRDELRARYGIPSGGVMLLFAGKLAPHKRPEDVLRALEELRGELPDLCVAFAGDGELRPRLQAFVAEKKLTNAFFLGFRNQSELAALYAASDILVLPSSLDSRPLVANEALACGLPVIVSDRAGVWGARELVRDGENGFVYPCGNLTALTTAIRKLAGNRELRERMARRSRAIINEFTIEKCADGILQAAKFVCKRSPLVFPLS